MYKLNMKLSNIIIYILMLYNKSIFTRLIWLSKYLQNPYKYYIMYNKGVPF